jgi:ribosomal protein L19
MNLLQKIEQQQLEKLKSVAKVAAFDIGDTVRVNVKVVEGTRERIQAYDGVCIARKRSKLYYLRGLRGKAARIVERTDYDVAPAAKNKEAKTA